MPDVAILVFDECQASAVSAVIEAFTVANLHWASVDHDSDHPFTWRAISRDGRAVRTMAGLALSPEASIDDLGSPDLIFVPAIRSDDRKEMEKSVRHLNGMWGQLLRAQHQRGKYLAANCSATFLLAEAGLLDGRMATTSWWLSGHFRRTYPNVRLMPDALVTKDDRIFCAAAFSACLNLGVEIVAEFVGARAALSCARVMLVDVNRTTQLPYANLQEQVHHGDDLVLRAQSGLISNMRRPAQVERLADRLGVTTRTLNRRFKAATGETPLEFLQKARIERARGLLETSRLGFDQIVVRVGYEDVSSFRRLFKRGIGISPQEYRRRFGVHNR
jgi:transcriptional regulator GlxA family with amidase domain